MRFSAGCLRSLVALLAALTVPPSIAWAQQYPTRTIRLVVPFAPGGNTDIAGRLIGEGIGPALGQSIVIDNKPGAGASIGADAVAKSPPDGYTFLLASDAQHINPSLYAKLPYNILEDFEPVGLAMVTTLVMVASKKSEIRSVADLIKRAKAKPGTVTYSSAGVGSGSHLAAELFNQSANIQMLHVPYKGSGPATTAVASGEVDITFTSQAGTLPFSKDGRVEVLAITGRDPSPLFPGVPTTESAGIKGYEAGDNLGLLAPKGTPKTVIDRINAELVTWLRKPETRTRLAQHAFDPRPSTPAEYGALNRSQVDKFGRAAKAANIKPE